MALWREKKTNVWEKRPLENKPTPQRWGNFAGARTSCPPPRRWGRGNAAVPSPIPAAPSPGRPPPAATRARLPAQPCKALLGPPRLLPSPRDYLFSRGPICPPRLRSRQVRGSRPRRRPPAPRPAREALGGDQAAAARPGPSSPLLLTTARPPRPGFPPPPDPGLTRILRLISVPISMALRRAAGSALRGASLGRCAEPAPRPQLCRHRRRYSHRRFWLRALRDPPPQPRRAGARRVEGACACACAHLDPRSLCSGALCWRQGQQRRARGLHFSLPLWLLHSCWFFPFLATTDSYGWIKYAAERSLALAWDPNSNLAFAYCYYDSDLDI